MYGDTAVIRRQADRMDERAGDLRAKARSLSAVAEATVWVSVGGNRMKERVAERRVDIEATATAYEQAADALRHHADEVDEIKHRISMIEDTIRGLISGAIDRVRDLAGAVVDGVIGGVVGGVVGAVEGLPDHSGGQPPAHSPVTRPSFRTTCSPEISPPRCECSPALARSVSTSVCAGPCDRR